MNNFLKRHSLLKRERHNREEIFPDEILADSRNIPHFDTDQFEGRMEKPISTVSLVVLACTAFLILVLFAGRAMFLEIFDGTTYASEATDNTLKSTPLFATRGLIYDRNGVELAWNVPGPAGDPDVPRREYASTTGLSQTLGYIQYPSKDSSGFYYQEDFVGENGVEKYFNDVLQGENGLRLVEVDARGSVQSQNVVRPPTPGQSVTLSIDSRVQSDLYRNIQAVATEHGFQGGSGIIMNVHTGEVIAIASYPEYDSQIMTDKTDTSAINSFLNDQQNPFLDRAINGLYAPGSTVKPYVAMGALNENIIDPMTKILSTGSISIPNPYDPTQSSVFHDWRPQGWVDMRDALSVSSDVYFYEVGGGYQNQKGLGITKLDQYFGLFGFGQSIDDSFFSGAAGQVPSPAWKAATFPDDTTWRIGDTYHTAIGQYGFQVSPVQMVRAVAAIANGGDLLNPTILKLGTDPTGVESTPTILRNVNLPATDFEIVREGLHQGVKS
ncbi:MAG: penicillin-binding transpeptidase domain-containing protein, partial [Candidatus Pacebacteria bacterium]|nr:penicillin-binding transpeptidase domain-containing protein [Candidatus Paceibacterota bacterium]